MGIPHKTKNTEAWRPPEELCGFRILEALGEGGMGKVYLARDMQLDRLVALKFMSSKEPRAKKRFLAEARALARVSHPNVVDVFRVDEAPGDHPFIAYEYVRGKSLDRTLLPVPWETALAVSTMLARALGAVHSAGLLHRDVKPGNVMMTADGEAKLVDFGLAISSSPSVDPPDPRSQISGDGTLSGLGSGGRLTSAGAVVGTPRYWAPEQWTRGVFTPATDVYALGLLMYEMLTGGPPHGALAGPDLALAVTAEVPPMDPGVAPKPFLDVVATCLRCDPCKRYPSGVQVAQALERVEDVFLIRGNLTARIGADEDIVGASWQRVSGSADELVDRVHQDLFEAKPTLRDLFPKDLVGQKLKLLHTLDLTIRSLHAPDRIAPMLVELGRRHVAYGMQSDDLDTFGWALRRGLAKLDPLYDDATDAAWEHAYGFIASSMRAGLQGEGLGAVSPQAGAASTPPISPTPTVDAPPTSYAVAAGASVAYQVFGHGPPDLVLLPALLTNVEATWRHPSPVALLHGLARFARVAILDRRGSGLSDPLDVPVSMDSISEDILAVMSTAAMDRVILVAASGAAPVGLHFAARHPARVAGLVLVGGTPFWLAPSYLDVRAADTWDQVEAWMEGHVGRPFLDRAQPEAASAREPSFAAWLASYYRAATSPRGALAAVRFLRNVDERASLPFITAATLVVRRRGDALVTAEQGRDLAAHIKAARYVEIDGDDNFVFAPDGIRLAAEIERFAASLCETEVAPFDRSPS